MRCPECGSDNPEGRLYCQGCGQKLDYSREEIEEKLSDKAQKEAEEEVEKQTRRFLVICIGVFLIGLSANLMWNSGNWPRTVILPSSMEENPYTERLPDHQIPVENPLEHTDQPESIEIPGNENQDD